MEEDGVGKFRWFVYLSLIYKLKRHRNEVNESMDSYQ